MNANIDMLCMQAQNGQAAPVMEYIRNHYTSWTQFPILPWCIENVADDEFIIGLYCQIAAMGDAVFAHPCGNRFLFDEPLNVALHQKRSRIIEEICAVILMWRGHFLTDYTHAIVFACLAKEMAIVQAYMRIRGIGFANDPQLLEVILHEDFVELMRLCLDLGTDRNCLLNDGRTLWEAAVSDEMRALLDARTGPIVL